MSEIKCNSSKSLRIVGNEFFRQGQFEEAIDSYTKSIALDSTDYLTLSNRAQAYLQLEKPVEALEDANKALDMEYKSAKARYRKALALYKLGDFFGAMIESQMVLCYGLEDPATLSLIYEAKKDFYKDRPKPKIGELLVDESFLHITKFLNRKQIESVHFTNRRFRSIIDESQSELPLYHFHHLCIPGHYTPTLFYSNAEVIRSKKTTTTAGNLRTKKRRIKRDKKKKMKHLKDQDQNKTVPLFYSRIEKKGAHSGHSVQNMLNIREDELTSIPSVLNVFVVREDESGKKTHRGRPNTFRFPLDSFYSDRALAEAVFCFKQISKVHFDSASIEISFKPALERALTMDPSVENLRLSVGFYETYFSGLEFVRDWVRTDAIYTEVIEEPIEFLIDFIKNGAKKCRRLFEACLEWPRTAKIWQRMTHVLNAYFQYLHTTNEPEKLVNIRLYIEEIDWPKMGLVESFGNKGIRQLTSLTSSSGTYVNYNEVEIHSFALVNEPTGTVFEVEIECPEGKACRKMVTLMVTRGISSFDATSKARSNQSKCCANCKEQKFWD